MEFDLKMLGGIFFLALAVEGIVEYFLAIPLKAKGKSTWWLIYAALVPGVGLSVAYHVDLPGLLGMVAIYPWIGWVLTGVLISRGANFISDLLGKLVKLLASRV